MNRIILIGNGFDLAHGLKTSYADFIDWYWEKMGLTILKESSKNIVSKCQRTLVGAVGDRSWGLYQCATHRTGGLSPCVMYQCATHRTGGLSPCVKLL